MNQDNHPCRYRSRSRSRSRSPVTCTNHISWDQSCTKCREFTRIVKTQSNTLQSLASIIQDQKTELTKLRLLLKTYEASQSSVTDQSPQQVLYILKQLNTKIGCMHMIPWKEYYAVNVMFVLSLCRIVFRQSWYLKNLTTILKTTYQCQTKPAYEKKLMKLALVQKKNTLFFLPREVLVYNLRHMTTDPLVKTDVKTALDQVRKTMPRTVKLVYDPTEEHSAVGLVPTEQHLQQLFALPEVQEAFQSNKPGHFAIVDHTLQILST